MSPATQEEQSLYNQITRESPAHRRAASSKHSTNLQGSTQQSNSEHKALVRSPDLVHRDMTHAYLISCINHSEF